MELTNGIIQKIGMDVKSEYINLNSLYTGVAISKVMYTPKTGKKTSNLLLEWRIETAPAIIMKTHTAKPMLQNNPKNTMLL